MKKPTKKEVMIIAGCTAVGLLVGTIVGHKILLNRHEYQIGANTADINALFQLLHDEEIIQLKP